MVDSLLLAPAAAWGPAAAVSLLFQLPSPPPVRQPEATARQDRHQVGGRRPVANLWLPLPPAAWRPAAARSGHFPLPPPPAV